MYSSLVFVPCLCNFAQMVRSKGLYQIPPLKPHCPLNGLWFSGFFFSPSVSSVRENSCFSVMLSGEGDFEWSVGYHDVIGVCLEAIGMCHWVISVCHEVIGVCREIISVSVECCDWCPQKRFTLSTRRRNVTNTWPCCDLLLKFHFPDQWEHIFMFFEAN